MSQIPYQDHQPTSPVQASGANVAAAAPRGLKLSLRGKRSWIAVAAAAAALWWVFVSPTEEGRKISTAVRGLERVSSVAGNSPPYTKVDFEVIRNTHGSIFSHNVAQVLSPKPGPMSLEAAQAGEELNKRLIASHAPGTVMTMSEGFTGPGSSCTVRASAQALTYEGTPYMGLVSRMGAPEDSFLLLLGHEMAHCFWNPALAFEKRMEAMEDGPGAIDPRTLASYMPLVWNISESYSDAYILMLGYRMDLSFYQRGLLALNEFRNQTARPTAPHSTVHAISAVQALVPSLPAMNAPLANNWDIMNRYVMSAALTGSMRWLMNQGVTRDAAVEHIQTVLQGQGVEFALKSVGEQVFIVVYKAPDGSATLPAAPTPMR